MFRRLLGRRSGRLVALGVIAGITAAGAVSAAQAIGSGSPDPFLASNAPTSQVAPAIQQDFSVFSNATSSGSSPAAQQGATKTYSFAGANGSLARTVTASDGEQVALIPSADGLCVLNDNNSESFCASLQQIQSDNAYAEDLCSPQLTAGTGEIEWLIPDGSSNDTVKMSDSSSQALPAGENVYVEKFSESGPYPASFSWTSSGVVHTEPARLPADVSTLRCTTPSELSQVPAAELNAFKAWQKAKLSGAQVGPAPITLPSS